MTGVDFKERLVAILAADVVGYSRHMAADQRATVVALDAARAVCRQNVELNRGRVIDMAGDSVLAVFETAMGAVAAALAIQSGLAAAFASSHEEQRLRMRIGVHLGDVIEKPDGTIYGDGVNIAARLQTTAQPGGITVSGAIQGAVCGKIGAGFLDDGDQQIRNIPYPVRAYSVVMGEMDPLRLPPLRPMSPAPIDQPTSGSAAAKRSQQPSSRGPKAASQGDRRPASRTKPMTILVADDHTLFRDGLAELLRSVDPGVHIIQAGDANAALTQATSARSIDLILLDLSMPGVSGFDLLTAVKSELPSVPVVVLSADETRNSVLLAIDNGAMGYIPKSSTWAVMKQAMGLVLAGGIYLPPIVLAGRSETSGKVSALPATAAGGASSAPDLTPRQTDVLQCLLRGMSDKGIICSELGIGEDALEAELEAVLGSLRARTRTEALIEASRRGLKIGV